MCGPPLLIATAATAAVQVGSSIAKGMASKEQAYSQGKADYEQAKYEEAAANEQANRIRFAGQRFLASQRAKLLASGTDPGSGSNLEVAEADAAAIELDALTARYGGQMRAKALRTEGAASKKQGNYALVAGGLNAGADALGGYTRWKGLQ